MAYETKFNDENIPAGKKIKSIKVVKKQQTR